LLLRHAPFATPVDLFTPVRENLLAVLGENGTRCRLVSILSINRSQSMKLLTDREDLS